MDSTKLIAGLEELAPPKYAQLWDNVGLLVGSRKREVKKIYIALDADSKAIDAAAKAGCDMILTHHPLLFSPVKSIRDDDFIGKRLLKMIENKINYYAMHTNFDVSVMAELAASYLGIKYLEPLEVTCTDEAVPKGIGCVGKLKEQMTLKELSAYVREVFHLPQVRFYGDTDAVIETAAMCPGSGKGMEMEALSKGAQVYITGDVDHHYGLDCVEKGIYIIDAGHHGLEHIFVDYMKEWLAANFGEIEVVTDRNDSPFHVI